MVLAIAVFFVLPVLVWMTVKLSRRFLRSGRKGLTIALVAGAVAVEALAIGAGILQQYNLIREARLQFASYDLVASLSRKQAPGIFVRLGKDIRDEVVLSPDGSFSRTASYRGVTQRQQGRWNLNDWPLPNISFMAMIPSCLRSTAAPPRQRFIRGSPGSPTRSFAILRTLLRTGPLAAAGVAWVDNWRCASATTDSSTSSRIPLVECHRYRQPWLAGERG